MTTDPNPLLPKVMDLLVDAICVVDANGRFVFVSAACERIFGYRQQELIGRNMIDLVYPADRARTLEAAADIMRGRPKTHFENRYLRKDGRVVHIMWSARWSEEDQIRLAVARDVTELKHAADVQAATYRISEAAHSVDGLFSLYREIHTIIEELLPTGSFSVALRDDLTGAISFPYSAGDGDRRTQGARPGEVEHLCAEVMRAGVQLLMATGSRDVVTEADSAGIAGLLDWLGVPLISQKGVMGALAVRSSSEALRFTAEERNLLQFVSTQVATAIERKQTETRLQHMARHDALTGLPNRVLFNDRVETALRRARRDGEHFALLYIDLDDFKRVNDTFGHDLGDQLLTEVARRLTLCVRQSDTVCRMGGDEFTVLLTGIHGPDCAGIVAGKISDALGAPFEVGGHTVAASASIGTAVYPEQGDDATQLFRIADAGMYAAKRRPQRSRPDAGRSGGQH